MVATRKVSRANVRKSRLVFRLAGCFTFLGADDDGGGCAPSWRVEPEEGGEVDVGRIEFLDMEFLMSG